MLWVKAGHIIFMTTWMAGLFYLPRFFVYHADCQNDDIHQQFVTMERKLFYYITTPGAIATTVFGLWLVTYQPHYYAHAGWFHTKMLLVLVMWLFHGVCWVFLKRFKQKKNKHSSKFFRWFNEFPTIVFIGLIILVVVKPF